MTMGKVGHFLHKVGACGVTELRPLQVWTGPQGPPGSRRVECPAEGSARPHVYSHSHLPHIALPGAVAMATPLWCCHVRRPLCEAGPAGPEWEQEEFRKIASDVLSATGGRVGSPLGHLSEGWWFGFGGSGWGKACGSPGVCRNLPHTHPPSSGLPNSHSREALCAAGIELETCERFQFWGGRSLQASGEAMRGVLDPGLSWIYPVPSCSL